MANNSKPTTAVKTATAKARSKNGIKRLLIPRAMAYEIPYHEALRQILIYESVSELPELQRQELRAIVSHWLRAPEAAPLLLDTFLGTACKS